MKGKVFPVLLAVLPSLSLTLFVLYGVLPESLDETGYWHSFSLGLAIAFLIVFLFLLFYSFLTRENLPEVHQGVRCPRCDTLYPKEEDRCPNCGEKNPEYREKEEGL